MSLNLYKRIVSVEIGPPGQNGKRISGLRISFNVKKPNPTLKTALNTAQVEIYNLSEDTRNQIKEVEHILILKAGYVEANGEEIIFAGNITEVNHVKNPPNVITRIQCGDGEKILRDSVVSLAYKEGAGVKQILGDLASRFNLTKKQIFDSAQITDKKFNQGFSFVGQIKTVFDKLSDPGNFDWSIQNDSLKFVAKDSADFTRAVSLSVKTGLLESPVRINDILGKQDGTKSIKGWQFQSLLQPKFEPGGVVVVSSAEIPAGSQFKIIDVEHTGDSHEGAFNSSIKAVSIQV